MKSKTPLSELIEKRIRFLGISREALGHRLGYRNPLKASGRIYALCDHHPYSEKSRHALRRLPAALELSADIVEQAVTASERLFASWAQELEDQRRLLLAVDDAAWRASFHPHAVIQTERTVPTQLILCGITGGARRWLMIPFDLTRSPITYVQQAVDAVFDKTHARSDGGRNVTFFGEATGIIINYEPDVALRCSLLGTPLEVLNKAYRPGGAGEQDLVYGAPDLGLEFVRRREATTKQAADPLLRLGHERRLVGVAFDAFLDERDYGT